MNRRKTAIKVKSGVGQGLRRSWVRPARTVAAPLGHQLPACAGALAHARGVLFLARTLQPLKFSGGSQHVPAGAVGCAVLGWRGDEPGWVVEFVGWGIAGLRASDEGRLWCRVPTERVQ